MEAIVKKIGTKEEGEVFFKYFENNTIEMWARNATVQRAIKRIAGEGDITPDEIYATQKVDSDNELVTVAILVQNKWEDMVRKLFEDIYKNDPEYKNDKMYFLNFMTRLCE